MRRVAKNTGIIIFGDIIFKIISLFITIYLARYLGTVGFGKYNFVFAYLAFFSVITDLGLPTILIREISQNKSMTPKLIGNAYVIKLILTAFAFVLSLIIVSFMPLADMAIYVYIAAFTIIFLSFTDLYTVIFQANLRMEYNIAAKLIFKCLSGGLILWIISAKGTLMHVIIALVLSEMVKTLISYYYSRKFVRPLFEIDFKLWKYLIKEALPIAFSSVIMIIYFRIDVVMLSIMQGDAAIGLYSAAYKLSEPLLLIPGALITSLFPIMSSSVRSSRDTLVRTYILSFRYLLIFALPIAIGTMFMANKIIFSVYGVEFKDAANALKILIWTLPFSSVNLVLLHLLVSIGKQKLNTVSHTLCAIANIVLNLILIPILSYNGAAIATVVTNAILFMISFYFVSKHLHVLSLHNIVIKPVISSLIMSIFIIYFVNLNLFLLISFAVIVYIITLFILKGFQREDINIIKKVIGIV